MHGAEEQALKGSSSHSATGRESDWKRFPESSPGPKISPERIKIWCIRKEQSPRPSLLLLSLAGWCCLSRATKRIHYCHENVKSERDRSTPPSSPCTTARKPRPVLCAQCLILISASLSFKLNRNVTECSAPEKCTKLNDEAYIKCPCAFWRKAPSVSLEHLRQHVSLENLSVGVGNQIGHFNQKQIRGFDVDISEI